ncbi:MAG TPA: hypothetical protein VLW65_05770 [Bryobacteraceae bacterium]|nr:hypothetical protein [Bryobacteraceae bacterium]
METHTEHGAGMWTTPQCPFVIEYAPRVLDDIRLAVVDAFFSLPRGGAEIGGILFGSHGKGRVIIEDYEALDCEHAFGPGFTLSDRDKAKLAERLVAHRTPALLPVGWYHSHTRSEIFLSEVDLEIHRQFFPEPWQVALVMKPHTFQPPRAGFFFRGPDGAVHATGSYREFQVQPLTVRQVPSGPPPHAAAGGLPPRAAAAELLRAVPPMAITVPVEPVEPLAPIPPPQAAHVEFATVEAPPEAEPEIAPAPDAEPAAEAQWAAEAEPAPQAPIPRFLQPQPPRSWRWLKAVAAVALGVAIGSAAYIYRQFWLPPLVAGFERLKGSTASVAARQTAPPAPAALGLSVLDTDGQLQIHWDRNSPSVRNSSQAFLEIVDSGSAARVLPLDAAHLESGTFTYAREGEHVDVALGIEQPGGKRIRESTTFLGKLPAKPEDAAALRRERDDLARQKLQLEADLKTTAERNRKLERSLADTQAQLRVQQRRRLENQIPK